MKKITKKTIAILLALGFTFTSLPSTMVSMAETAALEEGVETTSSSSSFDADNPEGTIPEDKITFFTYEDDEIYVTADLNEADALPEGTRFVLKQISADSENEFDRNVYYWTNDVLNASLDRADMLPIHTFFYDMYFEYDGERRPVNNEFQVHLAYKHDKILDPEATWDNVRVYHLDDNEVTGMLEAADTYADLDVNVWGAVTYADFKISHFRYTPFMISMVETKEAHDARLAELEELAAGEDAVAAQEEKEEHIVVTDDVYEAANENLHHITDDEDDGDDLSATDGNEAADDTSSEDDAADTSGSVIIQTDDEQGGEHADAAEGTGEGSEEVEGEEETGTRKVIYMDGEEEEDAEASSKVITTEDTEEGQDDTEASEQIDREESQEDGEISEQTDGEEEKGEAGDKEAATGEETPEDKEDTEDTEEKTEEEEPEAVRTYYSSWGSDISITVLLSDPSQVPDSAEVVVTPVTPDNSEFHYDAYIEALNNSGDGIDYTSDNTLLYDISFVEKIYNEEGEVIDQIVYEPAEGTVKVTIRFNHNQLSNEINAEDNEEVTVNHLVTDAEADAAEISADEIEVVEVDANVKLEGTDTVTFSTESFSVYAFTYTVDFEYTDEEGDLYAWSFPGLGSYPLTDIMAAINHPDETITGAELKLIEGEEIEGALYLNNDEEYGVYTLNSDVPFTSTYELTIRTGHAGYVIQVTDAQNYTIEFKFFDANGQPESPITFGSNYWIFAVDQAQNNSGQDKNYYHYQSVNLNAGAEQTISIPTFSIGNGNPNDHAFVSGETVTVDLITSPDGNPNVHNDNGTYSFQSDRTWSKIENGTIEGGYVFTVETVGDKTTYTGHKQQPYTFTVKTDDDSAFDLDVEYQNNWYVLSILKKGDNSGSYWYVTPITLSGSTVSGSVPMFYFNTEANKIEISNPGNNNKTRSSIYVDGDTVTTVLVHTKDPVSNYNDVLQLETRIEATGEMFGDGDGADKYTVHTADNGISSILTLTKAPVPKITVRFQDAAGEAVNSSILNQNAYYLYVQLDRGRGQDPFGYVTKLDINTPTKEYEIPYFLGGKDDTSNTHAYLTEGRSYRAYIVERHEGEPTVAICQGNTGRVLYDNGSLIEITMLDTTAASGKTYSDPNGEIVIRSLPQISVQGVFQNNDINESQVAVTGYYYLLISMKDADGKSYYHLAKLDTSANPTSPVTFSGFESAGYDGKTYQYTGNETLLATVVQSNNGNLLLRDAVNGNGCYVYEDGAITGDGYKLTTVFDKTSHSITTTFNKKSASASEFKADISFYTARNSTEIQTNINPALTGNYYLLATLKSDDLAVGYSIVNISADQLNTLNQTGTISLTLPAETRFKMVDSKGKEVQNATLEYDPTLYTMSTRLYHSANTPSGYENAQSGEDTIEGFDFWENNLASDGKSAEIKLHSAYKKIYKVQVHFSDIATLPQDNLRIKVEAKHATTGTDVYTGYVNVSDNNEWEVIIEDQTPETPVRLWDTYGTPGNTFSGNEKITLTFLRNNQTIEEGGLVYDYYVHYNEPERVETNNDDTKVTTIIDSVTLEKIPTSHDYNYYTILGEGVGYGITADYLYQYGHIQSNFATNFYYGNNIIEPDLAGKGAVIVIADYAINKGFALEIGNSHVGNTNTIVYLGNGGTRSLIRNINGRPWVHVVPSNTEDLTNNMVNPIIDHMQIMSAELLTHEDTIHPVPNNENKMYIDLLDFPEDATIYLNGDELNHWIAKGNDGLYITKHKEQVIVFNYRTSQEATVGQYHVRYAEGEDETYYVTEENRFNKNIGGYFNTESPTGKDSPLNVFADYLAQHVIFNLSSVKDIKADTMVGMILAPRADSTLEINGTSAGWIISAGFVSNKSAAEWHSVYAEMPDSSTTDLTIFKTVDDRTPGAHQVFNFNLDHLITTGTARNWDRIATAVQNDSRTAKFSSIRQMEIGWNVYRIEEDQYAIPDITVGAYRMDTRKIYAFVRYYEISNGVWIASNPRYYMELTQDDIDEGLQPTFIFSDAAFSPSQTELADAIGDNTEGIKLIPIAIPTLNNTTRRDGLEIRKKVTGTNNPDARFTFQIKIWLETNDAEHVRIFEDTETTKSYVLSGVDGQTEIEFTKRVEDGISYGFATLTIKGNANALITGIPVSAHYEITELSTTADITSNDPAKNTPVTFDATGKSNGYTNNSRIQTGQILREDEAYIASFTNNYHAEGEYSFTGTKKMLEREMAAGEFTFVIKENGQIIARGTVPAGNAGEEKNIIWTPSSISFTQNDLGVHTYTVEETNISNDVRAVGSTAYEMKLRVEDNFDGTLTITQIGDNSDQGIHFVNEPWKERYMSFSVTKEWKREGVAVYSPRTITFSVKKDSADFDLTGVTIEQSGAGDYSWNGNTVTLIAGAAGWPTVKFKNVPEGTYVVTETNHTPVTEGNTFSTSYALNGQDRSSNTEAAATKDGDLIVIKNNETIPEDNKAQLTLKKVWDDSVADADRETVTYELYQVAASGGTTSGTSNSSGTKSKEVSVFDGWAGAKQFASTLIYFDDYGDEVTLVIASNSTQGFSITDRNGLSISGNANNGRVELTFNISEWWDGKLYTDFGPDDSRTMTITSGGSNSSVSLIIEQLTAEPTTHATIAALGGNKYGEYTLDQAHWSSGITVSVPKSTGNTKWQYYVVEKDGGKYKAGYTREGDNTLVVINNHVEQQLGSVKVSKAFILPDGMTTLPQDFKIVASYTVDEEVRTVNLFITQVTEGKGTEADPYTWTIDNLPIGTEVTFTESGYNAIGYDVVVTGSATADDKTTAVAVAAEKPGVASFVNTYTLRTIDVPVEKHWVFSDASDGNINSWPEGVTVQVTLYKQVGENGEKTVVGTPITLSSEVTSYVFRGLPMYDGTNLITYTVEETNVRGIDNFDSKFVTAVSGKASDGYVITNTELEVKQHLEIQKVVVVPEGAEAYSGDEEFTFKLEPYGVEKKNTIDTSSTGDVPMPDSGTNEVTVEDGGTGSFADISYHSEGIYYYKITEQVPANKTPGMTYADPKYARVTVSKTAAGDELSAQVAYADNPEGDFSDKTDANKAENHYDVGSVQITKIFSGLTEEQLPKGFMIKAEWTEGEGDDADKSYNLKLEYENDDDKPADERISGPVSATLDNGDISYTWTISNLPIGTKVTFTESGYDVESFTTHYAAKASTDEDFEDGKGSVEETIKAGSISATLKNTYSPGAALPSTGGIGTTLFTILGGLLILGAGAALLIRSRRQRRKNLN